MIGDKPNGSRASQQLNKGSQSLFASASL